MGTAYAEYNLNFTSTGILSAPVPSTATSHPVSVEFSGISLNQNEDQTGKYDIDTEYVYQTFRFPKDYPRGVTGDETIFIPALCGFQINVDVTVGYSIAASLDWRIDYWHPIKGWVGIVEGTEVGAPADGPSVWFDVNFSPIDVSAYWWRKFRIGIAGRSGDPSQLRVPVPYDGHTVEIKGVNYDVVPNISPTPLLEGRRYPFQVEGGIPAILDIRGGDAFYTEQQGIESVWYTAPNPFQETATVEYVAIRPSDDETDAAAIEFEKIQDSLPFATEDTSSGSTREILIPRLVGSDTKAYILDGANPILDTGREVSLRFRILSTAPDSDRDCMGSAYRTVVTQNDPASIKTSVGDLKDSFWLSAPNPSQFACEALYFDISDSGEAQVVDHIVIDPTTPGIYMNVYYSNDPAPGTDTDSWDALLWSRVDKQFLLRRKESFALPEPVTAKYIKLEFTHLQPVWYAPGTFQLPTQYRKHPKWVIDYYLSYYQYVRSQDLEHATTVDVTYDALDLAYNYYLDDLKKNVPNPPSVISSADGVSLLSNFLKSEQTTEANTVDANTLLQIQTSMQPFTQQPINQGRFGSLLNKIAIPSSSTSTNYSTEVPVTPSASIGEVSSLNRDSLIVEKQFPVTSFYLTCRHFYMVSSATFTEDRAYFAGIKEVTFTREHYASRFDNDLYIETAGDTLNIESNDFESVDHVWVTYSTTD